MFPKLVAGNHDIALVQDNQRLSYADLHHRLCRFAFGLLAGAPDLHGERIASFLPGTQDYVTTLHGIWRAGGIAVPLNTSAAEAELEHALSSAGVTRIIANPDQRSRIAPLCRRLNIELSSIEEILERAPANTQTSLPTVSPDRRALILFTSGTTAKPKGAVISHGAIRAQVTSLLDAWRWSGDDVIPLFLPLHHIHGIVNVLCCALWSGATVHLLQRFDVETVCTQVADGIYTVFMAVPTIYVKLIDHIEQLNAAAARRIKDGFSNMRLNVSGSAACPVKVFEQWQQLTGQVLLERYGMTEVGMAISNPYTGERRAGYVGQALPGMQVQLYDDNDQPVTGEGTPGEIRMRGANLFSEYWGNPDATRESFKDGWFCSGDIAVIEDGYIRIMGRSSIDIIKSGGYKLSALEIEGVLLTHDDIAEVAVIGVPDDTWGEAVTAVAALRPNATLDFEDLKLWCQDKLSAYKVPKRLELVDSLPRNAMGKVTKPALKAMFA